MRPKVKAKITRTGEGVLLDGGRRGVGVFDTSGASFTADIPGDAAGKPVLFELDVRSLAPETWPNHIRVRQLDADGRELAESVVDPRWLSHMRPSGKKCSFREGGRLHPAARKVKLCFGLRWDVSSGGRELRIHEHHGEVLLVFREECVSDRMGGLGAADWRERYAECLGSGALTVVSAGPGVTETDDGKVAIADGTLVIDWRNRSDSRETKFAGNVEVSGAGSLTVAATGGATLSYDAGDGLSPFAFSTSEETLTLTFEHLLSADGEGLAVLSGFRRISGMVFLVR